MQFLFDFLPIFIFFITYKFYGIYAATVSAIVISFIQVAYTWFRFHKFEKMQLITLFIIAALGSLTLFLHKEIFIKWKPTAVYWILAILFFSSEFIGKKNFTQRMLDRNIDLPHTVWQRLNFSWVFFFTFVGAINLFVIYHFNTDTWVNFKLFGLLGLTVIFAIIQAIYLSKHMSNTSKKS